MHLCGYFCQKFSWRWYCRLQGFLFQMLLGTATLYSEGTMFVHHVLVLPQTGEENSCKNQFEQIACFQS